MNITLTADEALIKQARECARRRGTSLNNLIREQMRRLTSGGSEGAAEEFVELALRHAGKSPRGYRFDRQEAHRR